MFEIRPVLQLQWHIWCFTPYLIKDDQRKKLFTAGNYMEKQNLLETEENEEFKNMAKNVWINVLTCKKIILAHPRGCDNHSWLKIYQCCTGIRGATWVL
jgi:hypothetical protein